MTTAPSHVGRTPTAGARRRRFALQTVVLLLAITFACVFAGVIASSRRVRTQIDLTGSRQHHLSARTVGIVGGLEGEYDIVIAGDRRSVDPLGWARTMDVLDGFARASDRVRLRIVDTSSSSGAREFDELLRDLASKYRAQIDEQTAIVRSTIEAATVLGDSLTRTSATLMEIRAAVQDSDANAATLRKLFEDNAARSRIGSETMARAIVAAETTLSKRIGATDVPAVDAAGLELLGAFKQVASDLALVVQQSELIARATDVPAGVRERAGPAGQSVQQLRESADLAADRVGRLPLLPIVSVARTLERTSAALVIGPPTSGGGAGSIRAIEFSELFQARVAAGESGVNPGAAPTLDLRSRAEELISTALLALGPLGEAAPIVVFVHDMPERMAPGFAGLYGVVDRVRLRGMEVLEWATALEADPPALTRIDPKGIRPVVYVTLANLANDSGSALRMKRMADAQNRLVGDGKAVLLSMIVSTNPSMGNADPLAECLTPLGVQADTGRPLLRQVQGPTGRLVTPDHFTTEAVTSTGDDGHLIADAIEGLRCHFPWPVAISSSGGSAAATPRMEPIIQIKDSRDVWGESEWVAFLQKRPEERAMLVNPPANDSSRDDGRGAWTIVAAVDRPREGQRPQRAVVVGCSRWFVDAATQAQLGVVDGRPVARAPGNLELFEASVYWLAGQDEMIARSATAESVPLIPNLGEGPLRVIRWMLILGLPVIVLLIGAAWRLLRG